MGTHGNAGCPEATGHTFGVMSCAKKNFEPIASEPVLTTRSPDTSSSSLICAAHDEMNVDARLKTLLAQGRNPGVDKKQIVTSSQLISLRLQKKVGHDMHQVNSNLLPCNSCGEASKKQSSQRLLKCWHQRITTMLGPCSQV